MRSILILIPALLLAAAAVAGEISAGLDSYLDSLGEGQTARAIVIMEEQAPIATLNSDLKFRQATRKERHREVILALKDAAQSQQSLLDDLANLRHDGSVIEYKPFWISNMVIIEAEREVIWQIAARADVAWVEAGFSVELIEPMRQPSLTEVGETGGTRGIGVTPGLRAIRADEVWYELGINGAGRLVATLDTGVYGNHPALQSRYRGNNGHPWQECWLDVLGNGTTYPVDNYGHGTHVTGTVAGVAYDDTVGVAWGAQWIACNAIDQGVGSGFDSDIITALEWFADPDDDPYTIDDVPDVVQNSWRINEGFGGGYQDCDSRWWAAIDNCEASGVVTTWSAGNEGSGSTTIGSPADRATTLTNAFSIGAVDATNYNWPYPIAGFSSRGPTGCNVSEDRKKKPEVVAPGVDVYSSTSNGGYQGGWDGTSMAGPHAAGIVGLMREANPNLDVDTIKLILMDTARDEGSSGEDNIYGWGFVDAYEAVLAATDGFGTLQGYVRNGSYGNSPIAGASIDLIDEDYGWTTDGSGFYSGAAPAAVYSARASATGFASQTVVVELVGNEVTSQDFSLTDIAGPAFDYVEQPGATTDTDGPYGISATVTDNSTVASVTLFYRSHGSSWIPVAMSADGDDWTGDIPGQAANTQVDYYLRAVDGIGLEAVSPIGAPSNFYSLFVTEEVYAYDAESEGGWQLGAAGDAADSGIWVREDPVGTNYEGLNVQPEDDHTPAPGTVCFVTGNANPGDSAGTDDVDHGCTTLLSPVFDLSEYDTAFARYWRWYGEGGNSTDDDFVVSVSDDAGASWTELERVVDNQNSWQEVVADLVDLIELTDQVQFRFLACDENNQGLVEVAIDDFGLETFMADMTSAPGGPDVFASGMTLGHTRPNPLGPADGFTRISFALPAGAEASVEIYDISGRRVRTLADHRFGSGEHLVDWNGRDDRGLPVGSGVYFCRLKSEGVELSRKLTVLR